MEKVIENARNVMVEVTHISDHPINARIVLVQVWFGVAHVMEKVIKLTY